MYERSKQLAVFLLVFVAVQTLAFGQQTRGLPTKLTPPATGKIKVAFVLVSGGEFVDFAGPWSVFHQVLNPKGGLTMDDLEVFQLYVVSNDMKPIRATGGMQIIPDYTFANAPEPNVVVIPGTGRTPQMLDWIRKEITRSDVVMSVCVGGYVLAAAGLLNGKKSAAFIGFTDAMKKYPDIRFIPNTRWVQSDPVIFTSGPTGAGIDLALHVVELYFGRQVAQNTALGLNYEATGWMGDGTDSVKKPLPSDTLTTGALGNWAGEVKTRDGVLHLALHIWPDQKKQLVGFAEILSHDGESARVDSIAFKEGELHFEIPSVSGIYDGRLNARETVIRGTWKRSSRSAPLVLKRVRN